MFGSIVAGRAAVDNGANACVHILKPVTVTVEDADDPVRDWPAEAFLASGG